MDNLYRGVRRFKETNKERQSILTHGSKQIRGGTMGPERAGAPEAGLPNRNCSYSRMHLLLKLRRLKQGMVKINTQPVTFLTSDLLLVPPIGQTQQKVRSHADHRGQPPGTYNRGRNIKNASGRTSGEYDYTDQEKKP